MSLSANNAAYPVRRTPDSVHWVWLVLVQRIGGRLKSAAIRLPVRHIQAHYALAKFCGAALETIRIALRRQLRDVGLLPRMDLLLRGAAGEQQDEKNKTHGLPPFVNDDRTIYFFPEIGFPNPSESFGRCG